jgi:hypothetical protein
VCRSTIRKETERHVAVEWLTLLLRIREVPGANLGPRTCYSDRFFVVFPSPSRRIPGYCLKIRPRPLPYKSFAAHHSLITLLFDASY